jgi:cytochrome c-type biogenesis protein CcmH
MNAVQWFLVWAAVMCVAVVSVLAWTLRRASLAGLQASERENVLSQVAVYREHLAELQHELAQGTLDQAGFDASHEELTQRLLEDTPQKPLAATAPAVAGHWRGLVASLALAIPLLSFGIYFWVGTPVGIDPLLANQVGGDEQISTEKLQAMADQLRQRLVDNPNNAEGWVMLGRIERALGHFDPADEAFKKSLALAPNDDVQIERAEVLAQKNQGNFEGEPWRIIQGVLKADPEHGNALLLAGSAAFSQGQFQESLKYWDKVRGLLPASSPDLPALVEAINKARERLNMPALDPDTVVAQAPQMPVAPAKPAQGKTAPGAERISGRVSLDPSLASQVSPQDTVFIYANAADGPRMPLAIVRTTVDKLPYDFVLDDSMAMNPQMKLSHISSVMVRARISRSGNAMAQPGDLGVSAGPIKPGSKEKLNLVIAQPLSK